MYSHSQIKDHCQWSRSKCTREMFVPSSHSSCQCLHNFNCNYNSRACLVVVPKHVMIIAFISLGLTVLKNYRNKNQNAYRSRDCMPNVCKQGRDGECQTPHPCISFIVQFHCSLTWHPYIIIHYKHCPLTSF